MASGVQMTGRRSQSPRRDEVDAFDLLGGPLLAAIGSLSPSSLIPGGRTHAPPPALRSLLVPRFYFEGGRDRLVRMPRALSYGHRVDVLEMCLALSGSPLLLVEDELYRLWDGRLGVLAPRVRHFESCGHRARPYELAWFTIHPRWASLHVTSYVPSAGYRIRTRVELGRSGNSADRIARSVARAARDPAALRALKAALIAFTDRAAQFLQAGDASLPEAGLGAAVESARAFIRSHYAERISVADVAEAAHLSPNYLSSLFKDATGRTILEEIREFKLAEARSRLVESDAPVKEIARELGFESSHYFSRFFRRALGCTPSAYRARGTG
jgi:AraC-like DNA-binding protein